jgi:hypothetical protein
LTQDSVQAVREDGSPVTVVTQSQNQVATLLPFLLLLQPSSSTGGAKGPFGDSMMTLLFALLLTKR